MDKCNSTYSCEAEQYMQAAIDEALQAAAEGEVPVGAVIVRDGEIIARAHNLVETGKSSSAHAELLAIDRAERALNAKWLTGCSLYVTLEPCSMCAGAMVLARIDKLFIGAMDPKNGACGSIFDIAGSDALNHRIEVHTGVRGEECGEILTDFFRKKRADNKAARKRADIIED